MIGSLFSRIFFLILSVITIIIGVFLTVTLVFAFIGIPLLIIGAILLFVSIISLIFGTFGDLVSLLRKPFKRRAYVREVMDEKDKEKVIEVEERNGVYKAKNIKERL